MGRRALIVVGLVLLASGSGSPAGDGSPPAGDAPRFAELAGLAEAERRLSIDFRDTRPADVLLAIATAAGLELRIDGVVHGPPVDLDARGRTVRETLVEIGRRAVLAYRVDDPRALTVVPPRIAGTGGVTEPLREAHAAPIYPERARKKRASGKVVLQTVIDVDGTVGPVDVLSSTTAGLGFEDAAIEALRRWRYRAATLDGRPVPVYLTVVVDFQVDR